MGWETIGVIDNGQNIHKQVPNKSPFEPTIWMSNVGELLDYLNIA